jgi:preprotein translocase subunit SecE
VWRAAGRGIRWPTTTEGDPVRTLLIILIVLAIIALVMFILGRRRI